MADPTYQPKVYKTENGDKQVVASGGVIDIEAGGALKIGGVDVTAGAGGSNVAGVAAGYKFARGEATLDGGNPTSVATGLATIVAAVAVQKTAVAPGDDPSALTVDYAGAIPAGQLDIHAWKNTGGTDPTLIASTNNAAVVSWIAIGT